ncbi:MAG TPA: SulP family inorganic anion transporter [Hydrogenophaga sp.]|uniref:SulP family inorganic anion transporter n=1 Tax=Hydrogenophaga sp. TaxID=1904254 RepID=UPI002C8330F3|nr:SulP family inorganic anion transporter [Hydrogenophaga sp.]HMN93257.1 SulP family inorganic anion transporter [Hydrogenophaga sp.]HMP10820.1 SulP family inorganic anion transporter [Hydrogenophaga sp.]
MDPKGTKSWFPVLDWTRRYGRQQFAGDATAAAVVTLLLIPQCLAYALLAGMPAVTGLYASMLPLLVYALMGTSPVLGVGPAALRSIMSLAAVSAVAQAGSAEFIAATALLAVLVGGMLMLMGALRMGFIASFLSTPVLSGFVTASGLLIAMSQLPHVLGTPLPGGNLWRFLVSLWQQADQTHGLTLAVAVGTMAVLWACKRWLRTGLQKAGLPAQVADVTGKAAPLLVMVGAIALTAGLGWAERGLAIVGNIPQGLPALAFESLVSVRPGTLQALLLPAVLIAMLTFVEQISIAQSMAARRRERIDSSAEMRAMGGANLAAGLTGAFAVGASFSRTVVQHEAGARTPAATVMVALLLGLTALFFTPWLHHLPLAVLAATILMALGSLIDFRAFARSWRISRADFAAHGLTFTVTLMVDLVSGLMTGVIASLLMHLWIGSRPHIAVVGNVPGTEHYRNVLRHEVLTHPDVLGLRVDQSLFFANARYLEDRVAEAVAARPGLRHVVLQCTAVNDIDASALDSLETIMQRLSDQGIALHLSEVKGPVMDRLQRTDFLQHLSGQVFLTHHQAMNALAQARPSIGPP